MMGTDSTQLLSNELLAQLYAVYSRRNGLGYD